VATAAEHLPDDNDALKAALIETRAKLSGAEALIEHLQLVIAKMKRELFGPRSERSQRLLDQLELQLEELVAAAAAEDESAKAKAEKVQVRGFARQNTRRNFPAHLPRRRAFIPRLPRARAAAAASCRRSARMSPRRLTWCRGNCS
jgi:transposase